MTTDPVFMTNVVGGGLPSQVRRLATKAGRFNSIHGIEAWNPEGLAQLPLAVQLTLQNANKLFNPFTPESLCKPFSNRVR